ncbi:MAG: CPBP family intramembrane metalloprotease [Lachnospiraceae bacterium]|nr:CPBP family intramembrane metalloprotease [Lachnospiraceae bacterium]
MQKSILKLLPSALIFSPAVGLLINILIELSGIKATANYNALYERMIDKPLYMLILLYCIVTPAVEELMFRGLIYRLLRKKLAFPPAVIISAALFGLYHGNIIQFIYAFVMGIFFAVLCELSGSLIIPVLAHAANNVLAVITSFGLFNIIISDKKALVLFIMLLTALLLYWLYLLSNYFRKSGKEDNG